MEGGANEGGKGKSIWDTFTSQPGNIDDGSSGEVGDSEFCTALHSVTLFQPTLGTLYALYCIVSARMYLL